MSAKEAGGRIGAVHFETLVWASVGRLKAHVVKHGADIEQFGIDLEPLALAGQRPEQEHSIGVMKEQVGFGVAHQLLHLLGQLAIGHLYTSDDLCHG